MKAIVVGNCQSLTFKNVAQRMVKNIEFDHVEAQSLKQDFGRIIETYDIAFLQPHIHERTDVAAFDGIRIIRFPRCSFYGFHPDYISVTYRGKPYASTLVNHSAIILSAHLDGLNQDETLSLFNEGVFRDLKFQDYFEVAKTSFFDEWKSTGLDATQRFKEWMKFTTPFMLTPVHPKIQIIADMTFDVLEAAGLSPDQNIELPPHHLEKFIQFGVYPDLGKMFGMNCDFLGFGKDAENNLRPVNLEAFIRESFSKYNRIDREGIVPSKSLSKYREVIAQRKILPSRKKSALRSNPYAGIQRHQNWRKPTFPK